MSSNLVFKKIFAYISAIKTLNYEIPPFRSLVPEIYLQVRQFYPVDKLPPFKRLIFPYKTLSFLSQVYTYEEVALFRRREQAGWEIFKRHG